MNTFVLGKVGTGKTIYVHYQFGGFEKKHIVIVDCCGEYGQMVAYLERKGYKVWREEVGKEEDINISLEEKTVFYYPSYSKEHGVPTRLENWLTSLHEANEDSFVVFDGISHFDNLSKCIEISTTYLSSKGDVYIVAIEVSDKVKELLEKGTYSQITVFPLYKECIKKLASYGMSEEDVSLLYRLEYLPHYYYAYLEMDNKNIEVTMPEGRIMLKPVALEPFGLNSIDKKHFVYTGKTGATKKSYMSPRKPL